MKHLKHIKLIAINLVGIFLLACSTEPISFYWNQTYEYGTTYPSFLGKKHFAQNGKGFSANNAECELWTDLYYDRTDEKGDLLVANDYLHDSTDLRIISDTLYTDGPFVIMDKVVAYKMQFLEIWCKYPSSKQQTIGKLFRQCVDSFPQLNEYK